VRGPLGAVTVLPGRRHRSVLGDAPALTVGVIGRSLGERPQTRGFEEVLTVAWLRSLAARTSRPVAIQAACKSIGVRLPTMLEPAWTPGLCACPFTCRST
jgi:hypothetical protein